MAEENGKKKGTGLLDRVRQDVTDLKETIKEKGKEELGGLKRARKDPGIPLHFSRQAR